MTQERAVQGWIIERSQVPKKNAFQCVVVSDQVEASWFSKWELRTELQSNDSNTENMFIGEGQAGFNLKLAFNTAVSFIY